MKDKYCPRCEKILPTDQFYHSEKRRGGGFSSYCKACSRYSSLAPVIVLINRKVIDHDTFSGRQRTRYNNLHRFKMVFVHNLFTGEVYEWGCWHEPILFENFPKVLEQMDWRLEQCTLESRL